MSDLGVKRRRVMHCPRAAMDGARQNTPYNHRKAEHDESGIVVDVGRCLEEPWAMDSWA